MTHLKISDYGEIHKNNLEIAANNKLICNVNRCKLYKCLSYYLKGKKYNIHIQMHGCGFLKYPFVLFLAIIYLWVISKDLTDLNAIFFNS